MKSITILALSALSLTSVLVPYRANDAKVASRIVYVDSNSSKAKEDGSEEYPYKTLKTALRGTDDLEIHLLGNDTYSMTDSSYSNTFGKGHKNISIIGEIGDDGIYPKFTITNGSQDTSGNNGYLGTNLTLNNVEYTNVIGNRHSLFACGFDLTFGENCKVENSKFPKADGYETGIEYGMDFQIFAGCDGNVGSSSVQNGVVIGPGMKGNLNSNDNTLTFLSGDFGKITLSNKLCDTGTTSEHYKPTLVFGGTAYASYIGGANDWTNYIDATITIQDEARVHRIVGGIAGYKFTDRNASVARKVYIYSGKSTINIKGGYVKNIIGGSMGRMSAYVRNDADTNINVSGGFVESLIGGSAAGNTHGDISINVTGGTFGVIEDKSFGVGTVIDNDEVHEYAGLYCGGAGMSSMIHVNASDLMSELYGNRGCCYKEKDILDSSKEVMTMGNVYGKINANITGGTFNCNIHGGGKGFDHNSIAPSEKKDLLFNVGQVSQGVKLSVSGCTVNGDVYGGGEGIEIPENSTEETKNNYSRVALVAGTIDLTIGNSNKPLNGGNDVSDYDTVINGTVYGGGINPTITSLGSKEPVIVLKVQNTYIDNPNGNIALHGGSKAASVEGNLSVEIKDSFIADDVYLGSEQGHINGSIDIDVLDSKIQGDLNLGSVEGDIHGDVTVLVEGLSVIKDINVGSDTSKITGKVDVTISDTSVNRDINIRAKEDDTGKGIEVTINKGSTIGGTVNDETYGTDLDLNISGDTTIVGEMVYVQSFVRAKGNYGGIARLTAEHKNKPANDATYTWFKVGSGDNPDVQVKSDSENFIDLTPEQVGSYYCISKCEGYTAVKSNTARYAEESSLIAAQVEFGSTPTINLFAELSSDFTVSSKATIYVGDRMVEETGEVVMVEGCKTFKFSIALAPYEMSSDVRLNIKNENVDAKYSVKQYCREVLESDKTDAKMKNLVKALLNYGAAAQEYFDHATYNLANSYLNEADKALSTSISSEYKQQSIVDMSNDIKAYSATVEILTETTIRVYFVEEDGGSFDGYKAYVTGNGVELDDVEIKEKNGRHYVEITGISAQNFNEVYTVKLAKNETEYVSVSYSVLTYCYSKQNSSNESLKNFALSLFDYYLAVQAYLGK